MGIIWRNLEENKKLINEAAIRKPLIVFDTETTGLGRDSEIIEFAASKCIFKGGMFVETESIDMFIRPQNPVPAKATEVNGITNEFLVDKPSEDKAIIKIDEFLGEMPSLAAYNSAFDIRQMQQMYERQGREFKYGLDVDFYKIARDVFCGQKMKDMKLGTIANTYGVDEGIKFHSAIDDVHVLIRVINCIISDIRKNGVSRFDKVNVYKLSFYEGFRGNSRLYVYTSQGVVYYAFKDDKWLSGNDKTDIDKINMRAVEHAVFQMAGCSTYKELKPISVERYSPERNSA